MSTRYSSGRRDSGSDIDDAIPEGETSSKLFMNSTISRDVDIAQEEQDSLSSLSAKFDSSSKPDQ